MTTPIAHTLIRASAGTGKTFALSNRYLALLCGGARVDEVLASTFTRKAAAEILNRVLVRLAEAALDDATCAQLAIETGTAQFDRPQALRLIVELLAHLDRLQVMTLDSFFAQVAGRFALELRLPPGWTIIDELQDKRLRQEAVEAMLAVGSDGTVLRLMRLMTKGEARRSVAELMQETVQTLYTAWRESGSEPWKQLPKPTLPSKEELAATIEALRQAPLPDGARFAQARDRDLELAASDSWDELIGGGLVAKVLCGENTYYKKPIPPETVAVYQRLIAQVGAVLLSRLAEQTEATADMLQRFDGEYRRLKARHRVARFEDVTQAVAAGQALAADGGLAWRLEADVRHLLLDEFQDTSLPQWQAVRPLAQRICTASHGGSLFAVGDVKQAIYGWRGGVAAIFDTLTDEVPELTPSELNQSYRSAQPIIDTVNLAFSPAMYQNHDNLEDLAAAVVPWCDRFPVHTTAKTNLRGFALMVTASEPQDNSEDKGLPALRDAAALIADLVSQIGGRTIGVLVRKNATVARMIHELRKRHVDASEEGGNPLTDSAAVTTILSLLRLADHPGDRIAAFQVASSPLGPLVGLTDHSDMEHVCQVARAVRQELLDAGYGGLTARLGADLAGSCDARELRRLQQLIELATQYDGQATLRTDDFVAMVEETRRQQPASAAVRVMTVHQAKGLEFDAVVLPDLNNSLTGQTPPYVAGADGPGQPVSRVSLYRSKAFRPLLPQEFQDVFTETTRQDMDEALSLLYVMLTRPRQALYMIVQPDKASKIKLNKDFASLLRASLAPDTPGPAQTTLYEHGDADWWNEAPTSQTPAGERPRPPVSVAAEQGARSEREARQFSGSAREVELAPLLAAAVRGAAAESPSRLEGGTQRSAESLLRTDTAAAQCRGLLMHAWFEQVEWLDEPADDVRLREEALMQIARRLAVTGGNAGWPAIEAELESLQSRFRNMLTRPEIQAALSRSAYQPFERSLFSGRTTADLKQGPLELTLKRELRIAARYEGGVIRGQVDRLVLLGRAGRLLAAEVLDFKTDRIDALDPDLLAARVDFYRPQLTAYRAAVAQMFRLDPSQISARLVFVEQGVVAEV